jgi:hypothetical protein
MGMRHRSTKRSDHQLKLLVERAVTDVCSLGDSALAFHVEAVAVAGSPPSSLRVWAVLHFTAAGSPYCCGEPGCHLGLHGPAGLAVSDHVRRAMGLRQPLDVEFGDRIAAQYHDGVEFHRGAI